MEPLSIITYLSIVVVGTTLVSTLIGRYYLKRSKEDKLKQADEKIFRKALNSDDLKILGSYVDKVIGKFSVCEYVSNPDVSNKVDSYLEKLKSFVGTDTEVQTQIKEIEHPAEIRKPLKYPKELERVNAGLRTGEIWNALARLRRHIEITLREAAEVKGIPIEYYRYASARNLLNLLKDRQVVSPIVHESLTYAIAICNKAIHGLDVSSSEAEDAISYATNGLRTIYRMLEKEKNNA